MSGGETYGWVQAWILVTSPCAFCTQLSFFVALLSWSLAAFGTTGTLGTSTAGCFVVWTAGVETIVVGAVLLRVSSSAALPPRAAAAASSCPRRVAETAGVSVGLSPWTLLMPWLPIAPSS